MAETRSLLVGRGSHLPHTTMLRSLLLLLLPLLATGDIIKSQSFAAPFTDVDRNGQFTVPG